MHRAFFSSRPCRVRYRARRQGRSGSAAGESFGDTTSARKEHHDDSRASSCGFPEIAVLLFSFFEAWNARVRKAQGKNTGAGAGGGGFLARRRSSGRRRETRACMHGCAPPSRCLHASRDASRCAMGMEMSFKRHPPSPTPPHPVNGSLVPSRLSFRRLTVTRLLYIRALKWPPFLLYTVIISLSSRCSAIGSYRGYMYTCGV
ncbi:hypothetical protein MRX96_034499 [Rhipicephalus microplus]